MYLDLFKCTIILFFSSCSYFDNFTKNIEELILRESKNYYIVQSGDSVWSIAVRTNSDPQLIIKNNNLSQPYFIFPKQKLQLSANQKTLMPRIPIEPIEWHHPLNSIAKPEKQGLYWLVYKENKGQPIHSIDDGKVVVSGPDIPGYGNLVMISHQNGFLSLYAHCNNIFVKSGDQVSKGMLIADIGKSEASTAMLKFQLRKNGAPVKTSELQFQL